MLGRQYRSTYLLYRAGKLYTRGAHLVWWVFLNRDIIGLSRFSRLESSHYPACHLLLQTSRTLCCVLQRWYDPTSSLLDIRRLSFSCYDVSHSPFMYGIWLDLFVPPTTRSWTYSHLDAEDLGDIRYMQVSVPSVDDIVLMLLETKYKGLPSMSHTWVAHPAHTRWWTWSIRKKKKKYIKTIPLCGLCWWRRLFCDC